MTNHVNSHVRKKSKQQSPFFFNRLCGSISAVSLSANFERCFGEIYGMSTPIVKCGWLLRLSSVLKRWKKNYFVLFADGNLSYYEDDTKREKHGNINLLYNGASIKTALECSIEPPEGRKYGCLMTIVCKDKEEVTICAETNDECLAWKMMVEQPIAARSRGFQPGRPPQAYSASGVQYVHSYPRRYGRQQQIIVQGPVTQYQQQQVPGNPPQYPQQPMPGNPSPYPQQQAPGNPPQYQQQQAPVYNYPNYGPVQVLYTTDGRPYYVHPHTQVIHVIHDDDPYYYRGNGMMYGMAAGALLGAAMWTPFLFF